ncbi:MAG TPA: putative glycolipid-binding domain-containing protein [Thermoanaerobaculia bacterium]|nr:putative glycolipid-binding domain-containing protein [Thermoanaerobaculia bacterium]
MNTILWRHLDRRGHESCRVLQRDAAWHLEGSSVFADDDLPCRLDYRIVCDAAWRTTSARVHGWVGNEAVEIEIAASDGRWTLNGHECPQVEGCLDVDLNFSPATNLLPIRRLDLAVGEQANVRAAWLRFPSFALELLPQIYRRTAEGIYRYESQDGAFVRDLEVSATGFVIRYPDFFDVDASA